MGNKEKNKNGPRLLETLTMILVHIKKEINIPDIGVSVFLDDNSNLVIDVELWITDRHCIRHLFTKEMIYNDMDNLELKYFCDLCNCELNNLKEKLRRGEETSWIMNNG